MIRHAPAVALLLAASAPAGAPALANEGATPSAAAPSFEAAFAPLPDPRTQIRPAAGAVDLETFEAPVEEAPAARTIDGGVASYYGRQFHGRRTASGERFDMHAMTAAHRTLPFGSVVRVTNPRNGRWVDVRINDRGPFHGSRVIDVSRAAATELGLIGPGKGAVQLALFE
ncbi:MAG: septal ring lytic transglycosylase RlpA family protein [Qipengyuania sp.]